MVSVYVILWLFTAVPTTTTRTSFEGSRKNIYYNIHKMRDRRGWRLKGKKGKKFPCILNSFISSSSRCLPLYKFFNKRKFEWKKFSLKENKNLLRHSGVIYRTLLLPFGPMMIVKENSNFIDFCFCGENISSPSTYACLCWLSLCILSKFIKYYK